MWVLSERPSLDHPQVAIYYSSEMGKKRKRMKYRWDLAWARNTSGHFRCLFPSFSFLFLPLHIFVLVTRKENSL